MSEFTDAANAQQSVLDHAGWPQRPTLAAALVAALADLTVIEKANTVDFTTDSGKRVRYDFADIAAVVKLTRPVLAEHGLVALTPVHEHGNGLACTVTILHTSGERLDLGPFPFPAGRDAQSTGSMVTYHRRYALVAALGMAAGDDDDGASATARQPEQVAPPIPGFRSSLIAAIGKLSPEERALVREWVAEMGLPDTPAKMDAAQADRVLDYLMHGLPAVDGGGGTGGPSSAPVPPSPDGEPT